MPLLTPPLDRLISIEGGYTNDPKDSGGETIWGVTIAVARAFGYLGAMPDMTKEQAKLIYMARFWEQPRFDKVAAINGPLALELFDTGVNMGVGTASKFLQRALNVLNNGGTLFPDMTVDGGIGAMTLAALQAFLSVRKGEGVKVLMTMLNSQQCMKYIELAEARPKDEAFEFGWIYNRVVMS